MDEDDPWEALDVDDSDLPSLVLPPTVLPCKRPPPPPQSQNQNPNKSTINNNKPFLALCSQFSRSSQNQPKSNNLETLDCQFQQQRKDDDQPPSTTYQRLIPGPAGTVQAAMKNLKARDNRNSEDGISTQEYLKRISGEDEREDDVDFKCNSWLCAMEFLENERNSMGSSIFETGLTDLNSIKTFINTKRVPLVVAIVKSCNPNGLGDLIVTLKDRTGTVSANIHRRVLTELDFGKDVAVGSVLILQEVAVFSPSPSAHYLNITKGNLHKVISKDSGPPTKGYEASKTGYAAWETAEKASDKVCRAAERMTNEVVGEFTSKKGSIDGGRQLGESRAAIISSNCNSSYRPAVEIEKLLVRQRAANGALVQTVRGDAKNNEQKLDDIDRSPRGGGPSVSLNCSSRGLRLDSSAENFEHPEAAGARGYKKQKQQLISTTSLPEWTDEQLDELCADSWEDGTSLF